MPSVLPNKFYSLLNMHFLEPLTLFIESLPIGLNLTWLLAGYLGLEALDLDDEMSQICIYCGIIPEVVLGKIFSVIVFELKLLCINWMIYVTVNTIFMFETRIILHQNIQVMAGRTFAVG